MSEQEAERLYGPAPTGDEDPHASHAVPDPGETSGPPTLTAGQLDSSHLGRQVKVVERYMHYTTGITGTLAGVEHGSSQIMEGTFTDPGRVVLGKGWVLLKMLNYGGARVSPEATVELLD